jgi:3-hydroxyacyl-CoA dehydrogenase/enoyl-CoA hydratase/3-hydroxybutyryl-CoA epimerase/enoyl-CoA isomerase
MYLGQTLSLTRLKDDVLELTFDNNTSSVNKFDKQTLAELSEAIDLIKESTSVKGLLFSSAKSVFVVGADISEFSTMFQASEEEFVSRAYNTNELLSSIEDLPFPTVAAINGFALGGGLEICLACDFRVMSSSASIGLPETTLGIMPGWGGTVRLPRLINLVTALNWIVSGSPQKAEPALQAKAIDIISTPERLRDEALNLFNQVDSRQVNLEARRSQKRSAIQATQDEVLDACESVCNEILSRHGDNYPAGLMVAKLILDASACDRDQAIMLENKAFYAVTQTPQARALSGIFLGEQYVVKQAKSLQSSTAADALVIGKSAVVGAGIMGGGIAYQNALKGIPIVMKDIQQSALDLGMREANKLLDRAVKRGKLTEEKAGAILEKINPTLDDSEICESDIVVEAVVELESVKSNVLAQLERSQSKHNTVITSNTSTISINKLAESLERPSNFCGMHFFNPVHAMPLVEVIRGEKTSDATIAAVCAYALALGKKPVVVNDCPGFLVNRVLFAALLGMEMLIADGADFQQIDRVMEHWGLPMGPAYLSDVIGMDTVVHCYSVLLRGLPERFIEITPGRSSQYLFDDNRLGQKNGKGYYHYATNEGGRPSKQADQDVVNLFENIFGKAKHFSDDEIVERIMGAMGMEMVRCLEEGVVSSPIEADMALIYGIGFPSFRGGICRWLDELGLSAFCDLGDSYSSRSPVYHPTKQLRLMAVTNKKLYD